MENPRNPFQFVRKAGGFRGRFGVVGGGGGNSRFACFPFGLRGFRDPTPSAPTPRNQKSLPQRVPKASYRIVCFGSKLLYDYVNTWPLNPKPQTPEHRLQTPDLWGLGLRVWGLGLKHLSPATHLSPEPETRYPQPVTPLFEPK